MTMTDYYYKQRYKRLKRNNKCFIWSKKFLISVFLWCVTSSSNLFWTFDHKIDNVLPPKSPNDHQFRFHQCPLSLHSLRRSRNGYQRTSWVSFIIVVKMLLQILRFFIFHTVAQMPNLWTKGQGKFCLACNFFVSKDTEKLLTP